MSKKRSVYRLIGDFIIFIGIFALAVAIVGIATHQNDNTSNKPSKSSGKPQVMEIERN